MNLEHLLQRADIWRAGSHVDHASSARPVVASGHPALDTQLPGGGWPLGALTELLYEHAGIGELQLLLPAFASLTHQKRWLAWVGPPWLPYAPALANAGVRLEHVLMVQVDAAKSALWAMEQALRSGVCGAVLGWPRHVDMPVLRRLQLAAESGRAMAILFRPLLQAEQASAAALRLQLTPTADGLQVHVLKRRGSRHAQPISITTNHHAVA